MVLLGRADDTADAFANADSCRGQPASPRIGKRPRTTSSIFAAAAKDMLFPPPMTAEATPSPFAQTRPEGLVHPRSHVGSWRVSASFPTSSTADPRRARVAVRDAAVHETYPTQSARSTAAGPTALRTSSAREDTFGEAEAMAADEGRSSPQSPLPQSSLGYHRHSERGASSPLLQPSKGKTRKPERSPGTARLSSPAQQHSGGRCPLAAVASVAAIELVGGGHQDTPFPSAPAYEPSYDTYTAEEEMREHKAGTRLEHPSDGSIEETEQRHDPPAAHAMGSKRRPWHVKEDGISVDARIASTSQDHHPKEYGEIQAVAESGGRQERCRGPQAPAIPIVNVQRPSSPGVDRKYFLSTLREDDDVYKNVRKDLLQYMEGVRARTGEDGTPSVTFPRNFDEVVGLMGRNDLEDRSPEQASADPNRSGHAGKGTGGNNREGGDGKASWRETGDRAPPWTKYLLEEGLDRTKAFSRYRGMFAEEQTGEDRLMRGLAKMRELDLRLARVTGRARDLKLMAREAAEQAERAAAVGKATSRGEQASCLKGRGPVAVEDVPTNYPPLRLPLPLSSESAPFGPVSSRVSNASARKSEATALGTERSETSVASGSQHDGDGGASNSRDRQARRGRAFVTQNFRGTARAGVSSSNAGSTAISVNGSDSNTCSSRAQGSSRGKNFVGSHGGDSGSGNGGRGSSGSDGGGAGGSGGSSGVSFVLKNKRHAARASRRRLTDEQESLVSRFVEDADGFNDDGEPTGEEPSGVWAEITPYGGIGASEDNARLAEINAKLLAMRGAETLGRDDDTQEEKGEPIDASGQLLRSPKTATDGEPAGSQNDCEREAPPPPPPPPPPSSPHSRSSGTKGAAAAAAAVAGHAATPGDAALREQRAKREARCRERAIDTALEQLRDSLFKESVVGGRSLREKAVDTALELARSAPLDTQGGVRRGAGRIDSLLGGEGPQPVGKWEVQHALRQGEEELRGKDLASRERIEELLATVRQESAADSRSATDPPPPQHGSDATDPDRFPRGTSLDAFFSLKDERGEIEPSSLAAAATGRPRLTLPLSGSQSLPHAEAKHDEGEGGAGISGEIPPAQAGQDTTRGPSTGRSAAVSDEISTTSCEGAGGPPGAARHARPRLPRKKKGSITAVPPEVAALFRAPLLVPRHLEPPIAGIAAAAVAAGGSRRVKPGAGTRIVG
ncbi:unnamed protein product [Ectocarpus fasciculatus]